LYDNDPELRKALNNDINGLSLEEKFQIMTAYMNGGGVQALLGEDEKGGLDEDEAKIVEDEFNAIYQSDPKLREVLQGQDASTLTL